MSVRLETEEHGAKAAVFPAQSHVGNAQPAPSDSAIEPTLDGHTRAISRAPEEPRHAARTRCAAALRVLLVGGADVQRKNKSGSTPMLLATESTGRGGTGSPDAKAEQAEIVRLLQQYGATR